MSQLKGGNQLIENVSYLQNLRGFLWIYVDSLVFTSRGLVD